MGVRNRGKTWDSRTQENNVVNTTIIPSQQDHAGSLGVHRDTIARWEKDRKEIMSDPELAAKATTPEGYKEAKKVVTERCETVARKGLLYALTPPK